MVLTNNQTLLFFTEDTQMAIPATTVIQLATEGIVTVDDLAEFYSEGLKTIVDNLRRPPGTIVDPNDATRRIPQPPFSFGGKSLLRMVAAAKCVRYYQLVDRATSAGNMNWTSTVKNFTEHWKSLEERKKEDPPAVPKISKSLDVTKWIEAFADFLHKVIGQRTVPLAYVIREDTLVPAAAPALLANQPFSTEHESVEGELIARASHNHPIFRDDNAKVYYFIEEATRSTSYSSSIKPFSRKKDGRGAFLAIKNQFAGKDKWLSELKKQEDMMHQGIWKGTNNISLEKFVGYHRHAYISMERCADYIDYQLPNQRTRVTYLLQAVQCNDAPLQAAMALVRADELGKMNDFEATAAYLLQYDPVAKKRAASGKKGDGYDTVAAVSFTDDTKSGSTPKKGGHLAKKGKGKSGVEFRFYKVKEYRNLSAEQKDELREWRSSNPVSRSAGQKRSAQGDAGSSSSKKIKSIVSQVIADTAKLQAKQSQELNDMRAWIHSVFADETGTQATGAQATISAARAVPPQPSVASVATIQAMMKKAGVGK
jgi:hypothetical protein